MESQYKPKHPREIKSLLDLRQWELPDQVVNLDPVVEDGTQMWMWYFPNLEDPMQMKEEDFQPVPNLSLIGHLQAIAESAPPGNPAQSWWMKNYSLLQSNT